MFGYWYNSSFRNYIVMMGDMFSNIQIMRKRDDKIELQRVPITYASKERFVEKLKAINSINSEQPIAKIETILPRLSLNLVDVIYNPQFKTFQQNVAIQQEQNGSGFQSQYNAAPYKMIFELSIWTRYQDDMFQIVEQILPYFQPHFTTVLTELHNNEIKFFERDIRIVLQSIAMDETVETDSSQRRRLEWSLIFEVNGWIYPPVAEIKGEIRTIYLDFFANEKVINESDVYESVDFQVDPVDVRKDEWDGTFKESYSHGVPIPTDPEPPHVRVTP